MAYKIGSQKGKDIAKNMKDGETWTNDADGSVWTKNSDGSVSVEHNGTYTKNAYSPVADAFESTKHLFGSPTPTNPNHVITTTIGNPSQNTNTSYSPTYNNANTTTYGNYTIGSDAGKQQAQSMGLGTTWNNPNDGSVWTKNNDGTVTVNHNGTTSLNAYTPEDLGTLGLQQMEAGLGWQDVYNTYISRMNKAQNTEGLEQYVNDATQQAMWQYILEGMKGEYAPETTGNELYTYFKDNQPTYEDQYDPQMQEILNRILNREGFSYNAEDDPLYQQYAAMYNREGDRAMRNTMAEAAAGAGGMNSYAITAAQQANNYYASQLGDKIPELYQLAYQMYLDEGEREVQNLGLLGQMSDRDYNRYMDTMDAWRNDRDFALNLYQNDVANGQWNQQFDYNAMVGNRDYNAQVNQDAYNKQWDEEERDYNREWNESERDFNRSQQTKEEAWNKVFTFIQNGVPSSAIPDDLIQAAGMTREQVDAAVVNFQKASSGNGGGGSGRSGGGSGSSGSGGSGSGYGGSDESGSGGVMSAYQAVNSLGLGPVKDPVGSLTNLLLKGEIVVGSDGNPVWNTSDSEDVLSIGGRPLWKPNGMK